MNDISLESYRAVVHWKETNLHQTLDKLYYLRQTILCTSIHHPKQQHNPAAFLLTLANSLKHVDPLGTRFQTLWPTIASPCCQIAHSIFPLCGVLLLKAVLLPQI